MRRSRKHMLAGQLKPKSYIDVEIPAALYMEVLEELAESCLTLNQYISNSIVLYNGQFFTQPLKLSESLVGGLSGLEGNLNELFLDVTQSIYNEYDDAELQTVPISVCLSNSAEKALEELTERLISLEKFPFKLHKQLLIRLAIALRVYGSIVATDVSGLEFFVKMYMRTFRRF